MRNSKTDPMLQAFLAALLFGASAPISKVLLQNISPIILASLLYLGSGFGLLIFQTIKQISGNNTGSEAPLTRKDFPWILGAIIFGGIMAPIMQMVSL